MLNGEGGPVLNSFFFTLFTTASFFPHFFFTALASDSLSNLSSICLSTTFGLVLSDANTCQKSLGLNLWISCSFSDRILNVGDWTLPELRTAYPFFVLLRAAINARDEFTPYKKSRKCLVSPAIPRGLSMLAEIFSKEATKSSLVKVPNF